MNLGNGKREAISFPPLIQNFRRTGYTGGTNSDRFHIGIEVAPVPAMKMRRVSRGPFIQKTFTGDVVIYTEQFGWCLIVEKPLQLVFFDTKPAKVIPHRRMRRQSSA